MFQWQHVHGAEQIQRNINGMEKQWVGGALQVGTFGTFRLQYILGLPSQT